MSRNYFCDNVPVGILAKKLSSFPKCSEYAEDGGNIRQGTVKNGPVLEPPPLHPLVLQVGNCSDKFTYLGSSYLNEIKGEGAFLSLFSFPSLTRGTFCKKIGVSSG